LTWCYHGRTLTILYNKTGKRYGRGIGLRLLAGGKEIGSSQTLSRLTVSLAPGTQAAPKTVAPW